MLAERLDGEELPVRLATTSALAPQDFATRDGAWPGLAQRLSTLHVELPSLADRLDDLPAMAHGVLEECNAELRSPRAGLARDALERLVHYRWPGETEELDRVVRAACETASGPLVEPDDLPLELRQHRDALLHPRPSADPIQLEELLAAAEREYLERALTETRGNKTEAARLLGLTRPRLYRRMEALGLIDSDEASA